jgi:hypothetical protein
VSLREVRLSGDLTTDDLDRVLSGSARLPDHMVFRSFVAETVILNLQTGRYHGTNAVGGQMLEAMNDSATVRDAAHKLAEQYDRSTEEVERDIVEFCLDLQERKLIVLEPAAVQ